ncbi:MAG: glycosyltransferase family 4 protein [Candidatus Sungbacteria bacterium]|nr:glycosyltransferase family 4 protein [Candidatus Sungbacteria bacterium]
MKKLRIAAMVSGHFTTPPPPGVIYAPMDIAVAVSEGLAKRGHDVTFFAPEGSKIKVSKNETAGLKPLRQNGKLAILAGPNVGGAEKAKIYNLWDQFLLSAIYKESLDGKFDVVHIHPVDRALPLAYAMRNIPTVYTLHDPIYPWRAEIFRMFSSPNQHYVSISDSQRLPAPDLNYLATIYNGIDTKEIPFYEKPKGNYLLFVGRLHPEKGVAEAVEIARKTGDELIILGPPVTGEYWDKKIKPYLGEKIRHIGVVSRKELYEYYGNARATLVPIQWEEPFGLVMIESMATGTPVIAFRRGSVPEIVVGGKNGFIVDTVDEMAEAIKRVGAIRRNDCRIHVEENFGMERMIDRYEEAFLQLVGTKSG